MNFPISKTALWWWWQWQLWLTFIECSLHVRQYYNSNLSISLLIKYVLLISPLYRWWKLGPRGLHKFSRVIQPYAGEARLSPGTMACSLIACKLLVVWAAAPSPATFLPKSCSLLLGLCLYSSLWKTLTLLLALSSWLQKIIWRRGGGVGRWPSAYKSPRTLGKWRFPDLNPKIVF